jgi:TRAP transporter TAXI family solute receptor
MVSFAMTVSPGETRQWERHPYWRGLACASLLLFGLWSAAAAQNETETRFFRIGTAATGGSFFEIGGVVASAISGPAEASACAGGGCGVPGLVAVAQATQGSIENLRLLDSGQIDSAFVQADLAAMAYTGKGVFASGGSQSGPMPRLRAIASLFPEALHVIVRVDSPIRTIADLYGKTVSFGEEGSGSAVNARALLDAAGFGEGDVTPKYLRPGPAAEQLKAGALDALILVGAVPVPAISELAQAMPIRLVPVIGLTAAALAQKFSFYSPSTIPAGSYRYVDTDVRSVGFYALWLAREDIDAGLVYEVTRAAWSEAASRLYDALGPVGKDMRMENALKGISLPLHPGAERFYRERGMRVDDLPIAGLPGAGRTQ